MRVFAYREGSCMAFNKFGTPVAMSVAASCHCSMCDAKTVCNLVGSRYICAKCQQNGQQATNEAKDDPEEGGHVAT